MPAILKYFHEEPALIEPLTPDHDPDARRQEGRTADTDGPTMPLEALLDTDEAYRGYLAGRSRDDAVGLTTLDAAAYVPALLDALGRDGWMRSREDETVEPLDLDTVRRVLQNPADTTVLVTSDAPVPAERITAAAGTARRRALPALRALLDAAHVVFFPEPAHDGHDWSFFAAAPVREVLLDAFRAHPADGVRRFAVPYQKARSESKFYFETWQLTEPSLPDYIEEV
jgi:hypothetical protein